MVSKLKSLTILKKKIFGLFKNQWQYEQIINDFIIKIDMNITELFHEIFSWNYSVHSIFQLNYYFITNNLLVFLIYSAAYYYEKSIVLKWSHWIVLTALKMAITMYVRFIDYYSHLEISLIPKTINVQYFKTVFSNFD